MKRRALLRTVILCLLLAFEIGYIIYLSRATGGL